MKVLVLEGPEHSILKGWRHFQVIVYPLRVSTCVARFGQGPVMAEALRGKFYAAGTWEAHPPNFQCNLCGERWAVRGEHVGCAGKAADMVQAFPAPSPDILDELVSNHQQQELTV